MTLEIKIGLNDILVSCSYRYTDHLYTHIMKIILMNVYLLDLVPKSDRPQKTGSILF